MVEKLEKRGRGRPRKFDQTQALDKAVEVFWELGYEASDTETLSRRMGLSKPSLYNAFGSKEELFLLALSRYKDTFSRSATDSLVSASSPKEGLRAYFATIARDVSGQNNPSGCLIACVALPMSERMPSVAKLLDPSPNGGSTRIAKFLTDEVAKGALPERFDVSATVSLMQDVTLAMGLRGRAGTPIKMLEEIAARNAELVLNEGARRKS